MKIQYVDLIGFKGAQGFCEVFTNSLVNQVNGVTARDINTINQSSHLVRGFERPRIQFGRHNQSTEFPVQLMAVLSDPLLKAWCNALYFTKVFLGCSASVSSSGINLRLS